MDSTLEQLDASWKAFQDLSPLDTILSNDSTILDMPEDLDDVWELPTKTSCTVGTQTDDITLRPIMGMKILKCFSKECKEKTIRGSIACPKHEATRCVVNECRHEKLYGALVCENHIMQTLFQEWDIRPLYQCNTQGCYGPKEPNHHQCIYHRCYKPRVKKIKTSKKDE